MFLLKPLFLSMNKDIERPEVQDLCKILRNSAYTVWITKMSFFSTIIYLERPISNGPFRYIWYDTQKSQTGPTFGSDFWELVLSNFGCVRLSGFTRPASSSSSQQPVSFSRYSVSLSQQLASFSQISD